MFRTRSCSTDGSRPAAPSNRASGSPASAASPRIWRFARDVSSTSPLPRRAASRDRLQLSQRQAAARRADAGEPAVGRRLQGERAGAAVVAAPACSLRAVVADRVCAQFDRPSPSRQSTAGTGSFCLRRGRIVRPAMTRSAVTPKTRPIVVQITACMPMDASRKRNNVTAGNVFGTSLIGGSERARDDHDEQVGETGDQRRRRARPALGQHLAQSHRGDRGQQRDQDHDQVERGALADRVRITRLMAGWPGT